MSPASQASGRIQVLLGKTHIKKVVFFSGRTTKGVGRVNPLTKQKNTFFINPAFLAQKMERNKL